MAEGKPSVIVNVNIKHQEETNIAGDNVGQKTDVKAAEIAQVVVPVPGNSEATTSNTLQHDSVPTTVIKESEGKKGNKSPMMFAQNNKPKSPSTPSDVKKSIAKMNVSGGMKDFIACETSRHLMQNKKLIEVVDQIKDLSSSPFQQLMMSECYFQLGKEINASECVQALQTMMTSSPRPKVGDVIKLVNIYISDSSHIRALILLSCCAKLYKFDSNSNNSVPGIREIGGQCRELIILGRRIRKRNA
uniref:uncharacterized protein LOC120332250 n=1 Tax=Styela clava TaxID=7725 RepID=UPI001939B3E5|nr:uncharacterized protein LOC120332250 [Styela clava]